jgi:hypothetical protein
MKYLNQCHGDCLEGIGIKNPRWFVKDTGLNVRVGDIVHCVKDSNYLDQYIKVVLSYDAETKKFTVGSRYADPSRDFTFVPEKIFGVVILMFDGDKRLIYERSKEC